ncbi:C40 family peptidase [Jutongia sp.]|uniref:C40 family peptidase n=1 Tax=Jutongia sp. TaxID=2944204 RepID=UPI003079114D
MYRKNIKWIAAAVAAIVMIAGTARIHAGTVATEKPMAGINLSLDKYSDAVLAEQEKEETAQQETEVTAEQLTSKGAAAITTLESTEKSSDKKEKKEISHLKLNLKYDRLGVAKVDSYLNVRNKPGESSKIVGKMTKNSGCNIYKVNKGWAKIVSGKVKGYVKASYLVKDQQAEKLAKKIANLRISVNTETLNVRYLPSTDAGIYDQISEEDEYDIYKRDLTKTWLKKYVSKHCKKSDLRNIDTKEMYNNLENWMCISIDNEKAFVSKDFVKVTFNLDRAVSINESGLASKTSSDSSDSSNLTNMVSYAMQFLGNPYVWGGTSLTNGTDCSGFVMRIYEHFGYSLPRTSAAQAGATKTVSSGDVRPGDLFFYGSGGVSHVAMYIGNGQIIHASNPRTGIKISSAYYRTPVKIGRVIG